MLLFCQGMRPPLSSASSASISGVSSDIEEKVPLGDGVFCSKTAYNKLISVEENHADWAYALLKGVFGEKAHLMRVRITKRHIENEKFPPNFLMVAKFLHRNWLVKQKIRDENGQLHSKYSITEVEKYVNTLPAYLADRAYDMQGPRGVNTKKRDRDLNATKRNRSRSTESKRKYTRRGQPLLEIQQSQQPPLPHLQQPSTQQSFPSQQSLLQQQPPQQQPPQQQPPQQQPPQQLPHQELPPQEQPPQFSLQQPLNYLSNFIPPSTSRTIAVTYENLEIAAATFTTL